MKKEKLYTWKRYVLIVFITLVLVGAGIVLERSWHTTPEAHFDRAMRLLNENPQAAVQHLLLAQKSTYPTFQAASAYHLAKIYSKGVKGVPQNMKKAVYYYELASSLDLAQAQYELALLYDVGDKIPENRDKATTLMMEAAKTLPDAKYALAVWIERGYFGTPNTAWAVALYEQAANSGIKNAMKSLIAIYHGGYGRFPDNIRRELYWRRRLESANK